MAAASAGAGVLAACGGSVSSMPPPAGAGQGAKDQGPIRVYQWDTPTSPFGKWLLEYFQAFPDRTQIQVEILQTSGQGALPAQQAAWFASGDVPDVFPRTARGNLGFAIVALRDGLRPLTDFIKRDKFDLSDFWPKVLDLMTAKGKLWIMPQDFNQGLLGYLPGPFDHASVARPPADWKDTSWTWTEFLKRAQHVQQWIGSAGGPTQWAFGRPPVQQFVWSNGADYVSSDGKKVTIADPPAVEALDFVAKLMHTYRVAPPPQTALPNGNPLANQSVAVNGLFAATINNQLRAQAPDLNFDVCLFPRADKGSYVSSGGGGGYTMYGSTKHPDAAWEMLKYIGDTEYAKHKVSFGALGARISTARQYFVQPGKPPQHASVYLDAPAHARWVPNLTNWDDVDREIGNALSPLLNGEQSAKEAATNAKQVMEALLPQGELFA